MAQPIRFDGRVAIVTGAGGGLGRVYALLLAARGAKVVVNDLGGSLVGSGSDRRAAERVVDEIRAAGGEAIPDAHSVVDGAAIVATAMAAYGRVDVLVANAGILRDASFANMSDTDWETVLDVHLRGTHRCVRAAWSAMREARYGRIVVVTSSSGLYGNFGQANYAAAKMGIVGLCNTLAKEGAPRGIMVNAVAPIAASRMTEALLPPDLLATLRPEAVAPLVALLSADTCPVNGAVFEAGAGWFARLRWQRATGAWLGSDPSGWTPEALRDSWASAADDFEPANQHAYPTGGASAFEAIEELRNGTSAATAAIPPAAVVKSQLANNGEVVRKSDNAAAVAAERRLLPPLLGGSTGRSDTIDVAAALAHQYPPLAHAYAAKDASLYALSLGACASGNDDGDELKYVYENHADGFSVLPTFPVLWPHPVMAAVAGDTSGAVTAPPGLFFNPMALLHGEHEVVLAGPLPPAANVVTTCRLANVYDKGSSGAVLVIEAASRSAESGALLALNRATLFVRGMGGFGGDRGPPPEPWAGASAVAGGTRPDGVDEFATSRSAALLYRLNADANPLHVDASLAAVGGFDRPILHGLASFGIAGRAILRRYAGGEVGRMTRMRARFTKHVFPGDTLVVESWRCGNDATGAAEIIAFRVRVKRAPPHPPAPENDDVVLAAGTAHVSLAGGLQVRSRL